MNERSSSRVYSPLFLLGNSHVWLNHPCRQDVKGIGQKKKETKKEKRLSIYSAFLQ